MANTCPACQLSYPADATVCPRDGTALGLEPTWAGQTLTGTDEGQGERASLVPAGTRVGDYVFTELLGAGGMGEVYAAEHPLIGKKVAIKVLKAEIAVDEDSVWRMLAEARAVNAIRHRGIVDIFNFGKMPDGRPYLVMEYLVGEGLDAVLAAKGRFEPLDACEVLEEASAALAAAHAAGVIHRDLKPANAYVVTDSVSRSTYLKLLDFGLAKRQQSTPSLGARTRSGTVMGTPAYMAPEQALGQPVTAQSDLYSLGVMAFELLTGQLPFHAPSALEIMMAHVQQPPPRVSTLVPRVPAPLDDLVLSLMAKEPAARPSSADEVRRTLNRLRQLREAKTELATPVGLEPQTAAPLAAAVPASMRPARLALMAGVFCAAVAIGWVALGPSRAAPGAVPAVSEPNPIPVTVPGPAPADADAEPSLVPDPGPAPTPVAAPISKPVVRNQRAPTRAELLAELDAAMAKARQSQMSLGVIEQAATVFTQKINSASRPADRVQVQEDLRAFVKALPRSGAGQ